MKKSFIQRIWPFIKARYAPRGARQTFSTCGEDLIMFDMLAELGVKKPVYIDIGAHHPVFGNNTYLLYRKGGHGVLVEPNPDLCREIQKKRPRDICLNAGAGRVDGEATFYAFERNTRSTFSKEQAEDWERQSGQKPTITKSEIISLDLIIKNNFSNLAPDAISIDAEGYDVEILSGFSWSKRPKLICIESVVHNLNNADPRDMAIYDLFEKNSYKLAVQTRNNSIFIDGRIVRK